MSMESDQQQAVDVIAAESTLSNVQLQAALLDAAGAPPKGIAAKLGRAWNYVYQLRATNPEYQRVVREFGQIIARRMVDEVSDVDALFNQQIGASVATLIEVRDNIWAKDGDRLKASFGILDRASKAPKVTQHVESRSMVLQIPAEAFGEMRKALGETGLKEDKELAKLIGSGGKEERVVEEDEFVVRRIE